MKAQFIDYVSFEPEHYADSPFRYSLSMLAKQIWKMYIDGKIYEKNSLMPSPNTVVEAFDELISNTHKAFFEDPNYAEFVDDLMLYVDENNIALYKALAVEEEQQETNATIH